MEGWRWRYTDAGGCSAALQPLLHSILKGPSGQFLAMFVTTEPGSEAKTQHFTNCSQVVFAPKHNQVISTALSQQKTENLP